MSTGTITQKTIAGITVDVDGEGYLTDLNQWTEDIARELAKEEGVGELTDKHWQVINFVRKDTVDNGQPPTIRRITKLSGINTKDLYALFPGGPGKKASKIAGVPKPVGCV